MKAEPGTADEESRAVSGETAAGDAVAPPDTENSDLRSIRRRLTIIVVIHLVAAAYFGVEILMPIVMGFLLALTLSPLVRGAGRRGVPAPVSAAILVMFLGGVGFISAYSMSDTVSGWIDEAPRLGAEVKRRLEDISESFEAVKKAAKDVEEMADGSSEKPEEKSVVVRDGGLLSAAVSSLTGAGTALAVALVLALFLLSSGQLFYGKLVQAFPRFRDKRNALKIVYDIERRISHYLFTISMINFGLGVAVGACLYFIGMPYAPVWGVAVFLLNFLPFIGTVIGTTVVAAVSIVTFDSLAYASLAPLAYLACGSIEGQLVTPSILGRRLQINTVAVFLAVIFWAWLWGIAGALMAVPILVAFKVVCDNVEALEPISTFLSVGERPAEPSDAE